MALAVTGPALVERWHSISRHFVYIPDAASSCIHGERKMSGEALLPAASRKAE